MLRHITAGVLEVAYEETGPADGAPIVLLHGFPYDVHAFDEVMPLLVARGCRVSRPICAAMAQPAFSPSIRPAPDSRRCSATTWWP